MKIVIRSLLAFLLVQASSAFAVDKYFGPRITDGRDAEPGQFPYQVSIQWGVPPFIPLSHVCGGSILNENWVMTAGHCITSVPKLGKYVVKVGKHHLILDDTYVQTVGVLRKIVHPDYPGNVAPNDIGLLELKRPLVFNNRVQPVLLPSSYMREDGIAVLSGWGSTSKNFFPRLPRVLQTAFVPIVPNRECAEAVAGVDEAKIYDSQMCTGPLDARISACSGDSGGPLVKYNREKKPEQVGIVSWGMIPCGSIGSPSVYTRVSSFYRWILQTITGSTIYDRDTTHKYE